MPKTPEEIKKGLGCCIKSTCEPCCPYGNASNCKFAIHLLEDALAYIQQLEEEREAAIAHSGRLTEHIWALEKDIDRLTGEVDNAYNIQNEQLERIQQLEAERDAAVADLREADIIECEHCKHYREYDSECGYECQTCARDCMCVDCYKNSHWEWSGVQKEE